MTERYELSEFRFWLTSFEPDEQPFQQRCPIATWQQADPDFQLYFESLCSDWMGKFILAVDYEVAARESSDVLLNDWSSLTAKDVLGIVDSLELAS